MRSEEKTAADPGMKARMVEAPKKGGYQLPREPLQMQRTLSIIRMMPS